MTREITKVVRPIGMFMTLIWVGYVLSEPCQAQDTIHWTASCDGYWIDPNVWDTHSLPDPNSFVYIGDHSESDPNYSNNCIFGEGGWEHQHVENIFITGRADGGIALVVKGGVLEANNVYVYSASSYGGIIRQEGGTVLVNNSLFLGSPQQADIQGGGTYELHDGNLIVRGNQIIGYSLRDLSVETFVGNNDGNNYVSRDFSIGYSYYLHGHPSSSYAMSGGLLWVDGNISVGGSGDTVGSNGTLTINGVPPMSVVTS